MSQLLEIPVEPLSSESFVSFGEVIDEFPDSAHADDGFKAMKPVDFTIDGAVDLQVIRYDSKPMEFHLMERHLHVTETRVPLTPEPVVLVVAQSTPPDDRRRCLASSPFAPFSSTAGRASFSGPVPGTPWTVFRCDHAMPISPSSRRQRQRKNCGKRRISPTAAAASWSTC